MLPLVLVLLVSICDASGTGLIRGALLSKALLLLLLLASVDVVVVIVVPAADWAVPGEDCESKGLTSSTLARDIAAPALLL